MTDITESTYLTTFADYLEDRARTDNLSEAQVKRIEELAASGEVTGGKIDHRSNVRMWNSVAKSAVDLALKAVAHEEAVANAPKPETPEQKILRKAVKRAFVSEPTHPARRDLYKVLRDQGASPEEANVKLVEIAAACGASINTLTPGT